MLLFRVVRMLRALGRSGFRVEVGADWRLQALMREEQGQSPGWSFTRDEAVGKRCGGIWVLHIPGGLMPGALLETDPGLILKYMFYLPVSGALLRFPSWCDYQCWHSTVSKPLKPKLRLLAVELLHGDQSSASAHWGFDSL